MQEDKHHDKHQHHRFNQRMHHFLNRNIDGNRSVVRRFPLHVAGEEFLQLFHPRFNGGSGGGGVTAVGEHHRDTHRRFAVQTHGSSVAFRAQLDAGNVFQIDVAALAVAAQHDVAELFGRAELAFSGNGGGKALPFHCRQSAERAGGNLRVLRVDRGGNVGKGQVVAFEFLRINPYAHRPLGGKHAHRTHAFDALQLGDDVALGVVGHIGDFLGLRVQRQHHQEVGARFGNLDAVLLHGGRQRAQHFGELVLHFLLGNVFVGFRRKGQRYRTAAAGVGGRGNVVQALDAVHAALDHRQHAVFHYLRRSARVGRVQADGGRGHRRVLRYRQAADAQNARQDDKDGNHPGENRAVNKKSGHVPLRLLG